MARLKEEEDHFKRPQSTRGHFQTMSERRAQAEVFLSLREGNSLYVFFSGPSIRFYCPLTNLISLEMPGPIILTLLLAIHKMQLKLNFSLLLPLLPPSHSFSTFNSCHSFFTFNATGSFSTILPSLYLPSYDEAVNMQQ